jgi:hypothetical protein
MPGDNLRHELQQTFLLHASRYWPWASADLRTLVTWWLLLTSTPWRQTSALALTRTTWTTWTMVKLHAKLGPKLCKASRLGRLWQCFGKCWNLKYLCSGCDMSEISKCIDHGLVRCLQLPRNDDSDSVQRCISRHII